MYDRRSHRRSPLSENGRLHDHGQPPNNRGHERWTLPRGLHWPRLRPQFSAPVSPPRAVPRIYGRPRPGRTSAPTSSATPPMSLARHHTELGYPVPALPGHETEQEHSVTTHWPGHQFIDDWKNPTKRVEFMKHFKTVYPRIKPFGYVQQVRPPRLQSHGVDLRRPDSLLCASCPPWKSRSRRASRS